MATLCHKYEGTDDALEACPTLIPAYWFWPKAIAQFGKSLNYRRIPATLKAG
jgi:hypothetical protein